MIEFLRGIFEKSKISRNTTPKIVSILFALVLWLYVMSEVNPETNTVINDLKVELLNMEELKNSGLVIIGQEDFTVNAKIVGRRNEIFKITRDDIKVTADLRGYQQGVNSIPLEISQPANVTNVEITPQQIKVTLDRIVKNQKPVEIIPQGSPQRGYDMGEVILTPSQVLVEGPESKVNAVTKVVGEIDVEDIKENIRSNIPVKAVDSEGNTITGVEVKSKYVNVFIPMLRVGNVKITPQLTGEIRAGYKITKIEVNPDTVSLRGKEEEVIKYSEILTESINISDLDHTLTTRTNLLIPEGVEVLGLRDMPEITINVEEIETKEFTFNSNQISVNNLEDTLTTNIGQIDESIKVSISDVRSVLERVKRNDLELSIDGTDLQEGNHTVEISVNSNVPVETIEILPKEIQIQVYEKEDTTETLSENDNNNRPGD